MFKKPLFTLLALSMCLGLTYAEDLFQYDTLPAQKYNDLWSNMSDSLLNLYYLPLGFEGQAPEELYILEDAGDFTSFLYYFNNEQRILILQGIAKFKSWRDVAIKNAVSHQKSILTLPLKQARKSIGTSVLVSQSPTMDIIFFSQTPSNHMLVLDFPPSASDNPFVDIEGDDIYLNYENAIALEKALDLPTIKQLITDIQTEKSNIDALFQ